MWQSFKRNIPQQWPTIVISGSALLISLLTAFGFFEKFRSDYKNFYDVAISTSIESDSLVLTLPRGFSGQPSAVNLVATYRLKNSQSTKLEKKTVDLHTVEVDQTGTSTILKYPLFRKILCKRIGHVGDCTDVDLWAIEVVAKFARGPRSSNIPLEDFGV